MVSIGCVANNKLPVYKTITIDINKLDRNPTNLQNTSISECAINTTAQPVNYPKYNNFRNKQIYETENEELVINETSKNITG